MRRARRILLTLALAQLVVSLALLVARAIPARAVASAARSVPRPYTVEVPEQCPVDLGYALVAVARDPTIYRYADQNGDGVVCVPFSRSHIPAAVPISGRGRAAPNPCPAGFVPTTSEHVSIPELAGDIQWVEHQGHGDACLLEVPGRFDVVVIDNTLDGQDS